MRKTAVIIPIYNQERYLPQALDALLAQTCPDWIAYCVDDGSTDATAGILADYAARDPRFVVISQPNGGVSVARNAGLEAALANPDVETVCFSDPDDLVHPRQIELARRFAAECPGQVVTWDFERDLPTGDFLAARFDDAALKPDDKPPTHNIWDKIYPKEMLRDVRFLAGVEIAEDMAFSFELIHRHRPGCRHIPAALTYYRTVPTSTMHRPLHADFFVRMRTVLEYMISVYDGSPDELDLFCREHLIGFLRQFRKCLRRARPEAKAEALRSFLDELRALRRRGLLRFPCGGRFPLVRDWLRFCCLARFAK